MLLNKLKNGKYSGKLAWMKSEVFGLTRMEVVMKLLDLTKMYK